MSEWQPIETAPKDGTEIVCIAPEYRGPLILAWGHYNGTWGWRDWNWELNNPTHWFPLPDPPDV